MCGKSCIKRDPILSSTFDAVIGARDDPWARMVGEPAAELGLDVFEGPKSRLKKRLTETMIKRGPGAEKTVGVPQLYATPSDLVQTPATCL